jgi:hypothetical protein|nr:MAG TPA: hypothetical protein [Caudoviricetes sp.]
MSIIADWERQEFNKYDRRCCAEDAYNEAVEREIECIEEDISNDDSEELWKFSEKAFEDDDFVKAIALGNDFEEMRIKILTAMAEDRLEQLEKDYKNGYILND